jgi:HSP20 family molecular chaperone IbpA
MENLKFEFFDMGNDFDVDGEDSCIMNKVMRDEDDDCFYFETFAPGVDKSEVSAEVVDNVIKITVEGNDYIDRKEIIIKTDYQVKPDMIDVYLDRGVLYVDLEKEVIEEVPTSFKIEVN